MSGSEHGKKGGFVPYVYHCERVFLLTKQWSFPNHNPINLMPGHSEHETTANQDNVFVKIILNHS